MTRGRKAIVWRTPGLVRSRGEPPCIVAATSVGVYPAVRDLNFALGLPLVFCKIDLLALCQPAPHLARMDDSDRIIRPVPADGWYCRKYSVALS